MHRRKAAVAAAAVFAIGAAFAAQPTSLRADWGEGFMKQELPWTPGTDRPMSAADPAAQVWDPPR
jgi:hypothetical protein